MTTTTRRPASAAGVRSRIGRSKLVWIPAARCGILSTVTHGYVISDLHLFARRSSAERLLDGMRNAAERADFLVLNGDIFDFRWSTLGSHERTLSAAVGWLRELAEDHSRCRIFFIMGNHDGLTCFARRLEPLAEELANFDWHPTHLRVGQSLFFHGDLPLDRRPAWFERTFTPAERARGKTLNLAYECFVATRMHRPLTAMHTPRRSARRIVRSLAHPGGELADGVTDVYFGHTHRAFSDYQYGGMSFHNTGAAVRGLRSTLLKVRP